MSDDLGEQKEDVLKLLGNECYFPRMAEPEKSTSFLRVDTAVNTHNSVQLWIHVRVLGTFALKKMTIA